MTSFYLTNPNIASPKILPHALLGQFHALKRDYDKAIAEGERAIALSPGGAFALMFYAMSLNYVGRSEEAIAI